MPPGRDPFSTWVGIHQPVLDHCCWVDKDFAMSSLRKSVPIWVRALQGLGILLFFFAALLVYGAIQVSRKVPESYAAWTSGNILVGYLKTHTNQWPRSWDEIRKESETIGVRACLRSHEC